MRETTDEFIADCARLIETYHDDAPFSLRQVVVAPCQPVNGYRETFVESVRLARDKGVRLHTHVGEGESPVILARHGAERSITSMRWALPGGHLLCPLLGADP